MGSSEKRSVPDDHPVVQAMARAPVVSGRSSEEEREAVAAAAGGPWMPHEQVMAEVEARRAAEEEPGEVRPEVSPEAAARLGERFEAADPKWHRLHDELKRRYPKG